MKTLPYFILGMTAIALVACGGQGRDSGQSMTKNEPDRPAVEEKSVAPQRPVKTAPTEREMADAAAPGGVAYHRVAPATAYEQQPRGRERYEKWADNPVRQVSDDPLSTFSIDVDGASFSVVRSYLEQGRLPPVDAVRTEEIINSLAVDYGLALSQKSPVGLATRTMRTPWNAKTRLLQVGVQAWSPDVEDLPPSNYVFLIDVSGSMRGDDRLGLIRRAFSVMLDRLQPEDTVALVTYAAGARTVLEPTPIAERRKILNALNGLAAGGSTHGSDGIQRAYAMAHQGFIDGGNNRVILATDGDMNVGLTGQALVDMIERERDAGIYLTVLGVGRGNYMDAQLEPLADHGDGNYYYLDSFGEARRVLVDGLRGTAYTVAKDVKIQVEFNPAVVAEYRLIGYNNRQLADADFNNDAKDAGELGAGQTVTALYEITLRDGDYRFVEERRYASGPEPEGNPDELAWVKLRYKPEAGSASRRIERIVATPDDSGLQPASAPVIAAAFGEKLRRSPWLEEYAWSDLQQMARSIDAGELRDMIETAALLDGSGG